MTLNPTIENSKDTLHLFSKSEEFSRTSLPKSLVRLAHGKLHFSDIKQCALTLLPHPPTWLHAATKDQYLEIITALQQYFSPQQARGVHNRARYTPEERHIILHVQDRLSIQRRMLERIKTFAKSRRRFIQVGSAATVATVLLGLTACMKKDDSEELPTPSKPPSQPQDPNPADTESNSADTKFTREVEPRQIELDERIGVSHIAGMYPQTGREFLADGVESATRLGFSTMEIEISPRVICGTHPHPDKYPNGVYQFTGFCPANPERVSILDVAESSEFKWVFEHPYLKHLVVTTEAGLPESATAWNISHQVLSDQQLESTYREFFDFAHHLLNTFGNLNKEIIIQTPNELDWHMLEKQGGWDARYEEASQLSVNNAIKYLNIIHRAIADAKAQFPNVSLQLKHSIEVNRVNDARQGVTRAASAVLPNLDFAPEYIGYSAYDTVLQDGVEAFSKAMAYLKESFPDSNVFVSELGVPHGSGSFRPSDAADLVAEVTAAALDSGAPFVFYWQLFDNECSVPSPDADQCQGFWIVDPEGNLSPVYTDVFENYSVQ